jgi:AraC-like DNA-binding protein
VRAASASQPHQHVRTSAQSMFQDPEGTCFVLEQWELTSDVKGEAVARKQLRGDGTYRAPSLHDGSPTCLRAGAYSMVLQHAASQAIEQHSHPAWKIIIPNAGYVSWKCGQGPARRAAGVILPPQLPHAANVASGSTVVFIDPWFLGLGPGHGRAIPLDTPTIEQVRAYWYQNGEGDPDNFARDTVLFLRQRQLLPDAVSIDPRVAVALRNLPVADCIQHVAATVGLSPSRLRALIQIQTGTPPARLRTWLRLRAAIINLQMMPIAVAATDAGFADQAHLTRTATRLVGHTPRDIACALSSTPAHRQMERPPQPPSSSRSWPWKSDVRTTRTSAALLPHSLSASRVASGSGASKAAW